MINETTKKRIANLRTIYTDLSKGREKILHNIAVAEIPEMVYNSNAIENSTLSLKDTERILLDNIVPQQLNLREVFETKNLAKITALLLENPDRDLSVSMILDMHKILLSNINDDYAGRFRRGKEWIAVGNHIGANPDFTHGLVSDLVNEYKTDETRYFLDKIAFFHAEFETIHPFCDGNGRMGRALINQQLLHIGLPPVIIQHKSKRSKYYPLFRNYPTSFKYDGFTELFASLLMESLHKRITYLTGRKIIPLSVWAVQNGVKGNVAANKANRQTIPAFRLREKWMISAEYREN